MKRSTHLDHLLGHLVLARSENLVDVAGWLQRAPDWDGYMLLGHRLDKEGPSYPVEMSILKHDIVYPVIGYDLVPKLGTGVAAGG